MILTYRYITKNFFDVFWGDGWDNCARVKRGRDGSFIIVRAFKKPPRDLLETLKGVVNEAI
jgi:hypothetical protein